MDLKTMRYARASRGKALGAACCAECAMGLDCADGCAVPGAAKAPVKAQAKAAAPSLVTDAVKATGRIVRALSPRLRSAPAGLVFTRASGTGESTTTTNQFSTRDGVNAGLQIIGASATIVESLIRNGQTADIARLQAQTSLEIARLQSQASQASSAAQVEAARAQIAQLQAAQEALAARQIPPANNTVPILIGVGVAGAAVVGAILLTRGGRRGGARNNPVRGRKRNRHFVRASKKRGRAAKR